VTIMQMDVGLDTGDMLYKLATPITAEDNAQRLHDRLADLGAQAIVEALDAIQAGTITPEPQDDALANYARKLNKAEAAIDWQQPAAQIARQVAAFNPWPVAQSTLEEKVLRIWEAEALPDAYDPLLLETPLIRPRDLIEDELILAVPAVPRHAEGSCAPPAFEAGGEDALVERPNPFAALAALKRGQGQTDEDD
jgi:methionyl-tRNA formyltransferase